MDKGEKKIRKPRVNPTHRWSEADTRKLLEAVLDEIKGDPECFEKPTAQRFYEKVANKASLTKLTWDVLKSKMRHMKTSFVAAVNWKSQTGAGLLENEEEASVKEYIDKICPNFDLLEQLFGQRKNVIPAVVYCTSSDVSELQEVEENSLLEGFLDEDLNSFSNETVSQTATDTSASIDSQAGPSQVVHDMQTPFNFAGNRQKRKSNKNASSPLASLIEIQGRKLELEVKKFELEKEKEKNEFEFKKLKLAQELEIRKLELEKEERIEREKLRLSSFKENINENV